MPEPGNLSEQLAHRLKDAIYRGDYLPGASIPSERTLSDTHKLSRTTVRRAVETLVEDGILERRPGAGTFVSDFGKPTASAVTLGLVVPTLGNPYYGELSKAIETYAREQGYQLLIGQSDYTFSQESAYLTRYADEHGVGGVIVVPNVDVVAARAYQHLQAKDKPFVFLGRWPDAPEADGVSSDYRRGARDVVAYLVSLGHTSIAFVEGRPHVPANPLLQGYRDALQEAGLPELREHVVLLDKPAEEAGYEGSQCLLRNVVQPTAIFARNDLTASGVMQGLAQAGRQVPGDVSVVGFDSTQLAKHLRPMLTTVDTTLKEIGRQAFRLLLDRVDGTYDGPPRQILIQPRLVVRDSCGPGRGVAGL